MRNRAFTVALLAAPLVGAGRPPEFNRDIRPILSDKCWFCHGPDATAKRVPVRLDSESEARRVIVSGELIRRITAESKAVRMPPAYSGLALSDPEIETLRDRKSTRLNSSHIQKSRMPSSA